MPNKNRPPFRDARVAFVVLAWNSEKWLDACLRSVLALKCERLDIYAVDNGSTDSTADILTTLCADHPNLHITTYPENLGTTVPRNAAAAQAPSDTDYLCILDSDTVVNQSAFEELAAVLADGSIGVAGPTMASSDGIVQFSGRNLPTLGIKLGKALPFGRVAERAAEAEVPSSGFINGIQDVGYLLSACWLIPMDVWNEVGPLDEEIFYAPEDVDWCVRCHKAGYRVARAMKPRIVHEYQRLSHKRLLSKTNLEHVKGLAHYFSKHGYLFRSPRF